MNEIYLTNEKQARRLARQLRQEPGVANVKLYRHRSGYQFILTYDCAVTLQQDQLLARAERALEMAGQGYQVVWVGDNGLVIGPMGQVYAGNLDKCACADMQIRLAKQDEETYKGACKHMVYRVADLLVQANRSLSQRPRVKRRSTCRPAEAAAM